MQRNKIHALEKNGLHTQTQAAAARSASSNFGRLYERAPMAGVDSLIRFLSAGDVATTR
jgi:hypothetical protein